MRVTLNREVHSDPESKMEYYVHRAGSQVATKFYAEFRLCRHIIAERARTFPVVRHAIRRINFQRFPHYILFQIINEKVVKILVVEHDHRDPAFGTERR